jgi:predicted restriction endonuclease
VSEFNDNILIEEVNNLNNLIGLCRNHHKELDKGIKVLDDLCSPKERIIKDDYQQILNDFNLLLKEKE